MKTVLLALFILLAITIRSLHAQDGTISLPQTFTTPYPAQTGATRTVCASGCTHTTLQAAVDAAAPGDTITLPPGSEHPHLNLRAKPDNGQWIVIRSASTAFNAGGALEPGVRVDGRNASHTAQMARIRSTTDRAINTLAGTTVHHYRFVGLDIGPASTNNTLHTLIMLGSDATATPAASDIVIDRCYIHGNASGTHRKGVTMNGARIAVIDSHVADIHDDSGDDSALGAWNGPGPFKIVNNRLEAAGIGILFGSGAVNEAMSPRDIEIRGNLLTKPPAWFDGVEPDWTMKNIFELKDARRVLLEGNILENTWYSAQHHAIVLTVRNESGGCTWCTVQDVTFRHNIIRHAPNAINVLGTDNHHPSGLTGDVLFENNLFDNIDFAEFNGTGTPHTILLTDGPQHIRFEHNTFINTTNSGQMIGFSGPDTIGFVFRKNLIRKQFFGIFGAGGSEGTAALNAFAPGWVFENNGLAGPSIRSGTNSTTAHPPNNQYLSTTDWPNQFVSYNGGSGGNYRLVAGNQYAAAGNGDVGADIDAIEAATACAQTGTCDPPPPPPTLTDDFNTAGAPDPNKWTVGVVSGATQDPSIGVTQSGGTLRIGPLPNASGQHWNGIYSSQVDFTGAYAQVQVVQPVVGAEAYTMATIVFDASNYYRISVNNGSLVCAKEIGGVKTVLQTVTYNASQHAYVRIRHDGTNVRCEAAPSATGTWAGFGTEVWNTSAIPLTAVRLELKAGTGAATANAGTAQYDNFSFARP